MGPAAEGQPAPRLRLLALHGMGTSAQILSRQLRPLADAVADVAELVYLDGQEQCPPVRRAARFCASRWAHPGR
jgi:predicted esterase